MCGWSQSSIPGGRKRDVGVLGFRGLAQPLTAPYKRSLLSICLALELFRTTGIRKRAVPLQALLVIRQTLIRFFASFLHILSIDLVSDR